MPLCVHCGHLVDSLYTTYSPSNIVCTKCPQCRNFADPYLEHDSLLVVLDLLLVKPRVYRHLLYNSSRRRLHHKPWRERMQVLRYLVAVILVDAYLRWTSIYTDNDGAPDQEYTALEQIMLKFIPYAKSALVLRAGSLKDLKPVFGSYALVTLATSIELLSWHGVIAVLAWIVRYCSPSQRPSPIQSQQQNLSGDLSKQDPPPSPTPSQPTDPTSSSTIEQGTGAEDLFEISIVPRALIFSTLTPLLLLLLNFLWRSEGDTAWNPLPASHDGPEPPPRISCSPDWLCRKVLQWADETDFSIEWVARTLMGGVSAGVALGVILPRRPKATMLILCVATYVQMLLRYTLHLEPSVYEP